MSDPDSTKVDVGVDLPFIGKVGAKVNSPNRCPPGYFWVPTYKKKSFWGSTTVRGHCRSAIGYEKERELAQEQKYKLQQEKIRLKQIKAEKKNRKRRTL